MDNGKLSICGEESFGTGSDHIREKDGIWAVLAWLSILATRSKQRGKLVGVEDITREFWKEYGRHYYTRHDFENVEKEGAEKMMQHLKSLISGGKFEGSKHSAGGETYVVKKIDSFSYEDPFDKSVAKDQGIRVLFEDGSRLIFRLSGTGSVGATVRVYIDKYEDDPKKQFKDTQEALKSIISIGLTISKLQQFTGRKEPSVIT